METIAVTGATGRLGSTVLNHLIGNPSIRPVAVVRDITKLQGASGDRMESRMADYGDRASLETAFQGVQTVLQISTTAVAAEGIAHESNVIEAARRAGVGHIVYTGSLRARSSSEFQGAHQALAAEHAIRNSGMSWTFFRNGLYFETLPQLLGEFRTTGRVRYPAGNGCVAFVARGDIARAIAKVLTSVTRENRAYEITGASSHSFTDLAAMLTRLCGTAVAYECIDDQSYRESLTPFVPKDVADFLTSMARGIRAGEFDIPDPALRELLEGNPASLEDYLADEFGSDSAQSSDP